MNRTACFHSYEAHPWLGRQYAKLSMSEQLGCDRFLTSTSHLNSNEFELALNRLFMSGKPRPKNWKIMSELMSCANSLAQNIAINKGEKNEK